MKDNGFSIIAISMITSAKPYSMFAKMPKGVMLEHYQ